MTSIAIGIIREREIVNFIFGIIYIGMLDNGNDDKAREKINGLSKS